MHAPLDVPARQLVCSDYIRALEECHAAGMWKLFGACNKEKKELSMCLRKERIDRTTKNREEAKMRTAKKKQVWGDLDREIAGAGAEEVPSQGPVPVETS